MSTGLLSRAGEVKRLALVIILIALAGTAGAGQDRPDAKNAVVIKPVADMFSEPSEDVDVVSQAILGSNVKIVEEKQEWVKVRTADDYLGWMPLRLLRRLDPGEKAYASAGRVAQVVNLSANLYREPDVTKRAPMVTAPFETRLELMAPVSESDRWLRVKLPDGRPAWVQRGDTTLDAGPMSIEESIALAKRFLGVTYYWGGTSSFGFDCSGFTQMLVRMRGITMPRDADLQAAWAGVVAVKREELKPGDLLFFGSSDKKITHTGMYIGQGEFIHDTTNTRPMVQISRLDDQPWTRLLVASRRIK